MSGGGMQMIGAIGNVVVGSEALRFGFTDVDGCGHGN